MKFTPQKLGGWGYRIMVKLPFFTMDCTLF